MPKGLGPIHREIYPRGIPPILHSHLDLHHLSAGLLEERENSLCLHRRLVGIRHDLHHLRGILHPLVDLHHLNVGLLEERENSLCLHHQLVGIRHDLHHLGGILHPLVDLHHLNVGLLERENSLHLHHRLVGIRQDLHHLRGIPHILHSPVDLHHLNASLLEEKGNSLCGGRGNLSGDGPFALSIESMYSIVPATRAPYILDDAYTRSVPTANHGSLHQTSGLV